MSPTQKPVAYTTTGDKISIEFLVREYYATVHRIALSILDDPNDADDAVQDTFIAANRSLHEFRGEAQIKTWLTSIVINVCRGRLRKRKLHQSLQKTLQALHIHQNTPTSMDDYAESHEIDRQIWLAVDSLDDKHRLPILLRYVHQMSVPEISKALNLNEGTVYSRLHYARYALQARLGHLNPQEEVSDDASFTR